MTPDQPAVLSEEQGRSVLRFERLLAHTPERVWRALVEPGELAHWHPSPFDFEPTLGGRVNYRAGHAAAADVSGPEALAEDEPHFLDRTPGPVLARLDRAEDRV